MPLKKDIRRTRQRKRSNEEQQLKRIIFYPKKLLSIAWDRR